MSYYNHEEVRPVGHSGPWSKIMNVPHGHVFGSAVAMFLPVVVIMITAMIALGTNNWEQPDWNVDNPLRYADWGFWTSAVVSTLLYGWMLYLLYRHEQTRSRYRLWLLLLMPVLFGAIFIGIAYSKDHDAVPAAYVSYFALGTTIASIAAVAGCARMPEVVFYALPLLTWFAYETNLVSTEAAYVAPIPPP